MSAVDLRSLQRQYPGVRGWLTIPEVGIDYPVMQSSREDPEYYLRRDYQGATRRRIQAYEAGIISENGMNNGILEDTRNGLLDEYEQDMLINPSVAFTKLGDGYFDALGAGDVLKLKEKTRRFLRSANRSESEDGAPGYSCLLYTSDAADD